MGISKIGVIHGRFQPPHLGHEEYLLEAKKRCQYLLIGLANPDPSHTKHNKAKPSRSDTKNNPFTYYERMLMVRELMLNRGVGKTDFDIVPFPINYPELLQFYVPMDARFFLTIYDDWGREKLKLFMSLGLDVEVMWERKMSDRFTTGTEVRTLIAEGGNWQKLVPSGVAKVITDLQLSRKMRK